MTKTFDLFEGLLTCFERYNCICQNLFVFMNLKSGNANFTFHKSNHNHMQKNQVFLCFLFASIYRAPLQITKLRTHFKEHDKVLKRVPNRATPLRPAGPWASPSPESSGGGARFTNPSGSPRPFPPSPFLFAGAPGDAAGNLYNWTCLSNSRWRHHLTAAPGCIEATPGARRWRRRRRSRGGGDQLPHLPANTKRQTLISLFRPSRHLWPLKITAWIWSQIFLLFKIRIGEYRQVNPRLFLADS